MAEIKIADGGSLKRFRKWIQSKYYTKDDTFTKAEVNTKIDSIAFKQASSTEAGIAKLYSALGQNTDGAPTNKAVQNAVNEVMKTLYPVGSIYLTISTNPLNPSGSSPASWLGGQWELLPADKALWTASSGAGGTIDAGLPNIKGETTLRYIRNGYEDSTSDNKATSALYNGTGVPSECASGRETYIAAPFYFDASRSSSIYRDNVTTVQPPAYKVYAWRRKA